MKKEYHYTISRTDRICLIIFVVILLGWELIKQVLPSGASTFTYVSPPSSHKGFGNKKEKNYSVHYSSTKSKYSHPRNFEKQYSSYQDEQEIYTPIMRSLPPSPLLIQTASIDELISIGLSKKVAFNIQKFISAGGMITDSAHLAKIYGMDSLQLKNALPHILFATLPSPEEKEKIVAEEIKVKPSPKIIDLNHASSDELESLDGIGAVLAERIIKFRNSLGGFRTPEQLKDCYGIPPETFEKIKDQVTATGTPQFVFINEVNLDTLNHPYLSKKQIRMIKAYKQQHGFFKDASSFRKVYPPDSTWCNKILPYISFGTKDYDH